jgi:holo-[acyl-carrier protein] synthase
MMVLLEFTGYFVEFFFEKYMLIGIGTDIVLTARIQASIDQYGEQFLARVFTYEERIYCDAQAQPLPSYAARFAAKEAFSKAIGTGISGETTWKSIEVVKASSGAVSVRLHGALAGEYEDCRVLLSLSHTSESAVAMVAIERLGTREVAEDDDEAPIS